jgi:hypothetical protein
MVKLIFDLWPKMCLYNRLRVKTCVREQSNLDIQQSNLDIRAGMMQ